MPKKKRKDFDGQPTAAEAKKVFKARKSGKDSDKSQYHDNGNNTSQSL